MADARAHESLLELRHRAQVAEATGHGRSATTPELPIAARVVRRYRARLFQLYVAAATAGFAVLFYYARRVAYFRFDLQLAQWVQHWKAAWLDAAMSAISQLGFSPLAPAVVVLTMMATFRIGLKWETVMLMVTGAGVGALNAGFKILVQRQRPAPDLVNVFSELSDYSFPSGHVLLFTAYFGFLLFLTYTLMSRSRTRAVITATLGGLIALVGVSRVYLGHHWPSDVLGAYLLGSLWLALVVFLYRKGKRRFFTRQPLAPGAPPAGR